MDLDQTCNKDQEVRMDTGVTSTISTITKDIQINNNAPEVKTDIAEINIKGTKDHLMTRTDGNITTMDNSTNNDTTINNTITTMIDDLDLGMDVEAKMDTNHETSSTTLATQIEHPLDNETTTMIITKIDLTTHTIDLNNNNKGITTSPQKNQQTHHKNKTALETQDINPSQYKLD